MKAMQVLKKKKGFTLIEIIVVLIILAILAAAGIPSMIGFIDDARGKAYIAEARVGFVAAQVVLTENKGDFSKVKATDLNAANGRFQGLVKGVTAPTGFSNVTGSNGQVEGIDYVVDGYTIKITKDGTTVAKS